MPPKSLIIDHFPLIIDGAFKGMEAGTPAPGFRRDRVAGVQKCLFSWIPAFAGMTGKVISWLFTKVSMFNAQ